MSRSRSLAPDADPLVVTIALVIALVIEPALVGAQAEPSRGGEPGSEREPEPAEAEVGTTLEEDIAHIDASHVVAPLEAVTLGALTQTFLGGSSETVLTPILAVMLAPWISVGVGELDIQWLWDEDRFESVPIGLAVDTVFDVSGQHVRASVQPQYGLHDTEGVFEWRLAGQVSLLAR